MKHLLLTLLLLLAAMESQAQFRVMTDIYERPMDIDAKVNYSMRDPSGGRADDKCAIIKIATTDMGFTFDLGSTLKVVKGEKKPDKMEIWLWVPVGTRHMTITHPRYGQLNTKDGFYEFNLQTKSATVYAMRLHTDYSSDGDITTNEHVFRTVQFSVYPHEARVLLRKMPLATDSLGHLNQDVPLGKYNFRVSADRYHDYDGSFELTEETTVLPINIRLHQAWGWLSLDRQMRVPGISISVDGKTRSEINRLELNTGRHAVRIEAPNYEMLEEVIDIQDSTELVYKPQLTPIMGSLNIRSTPSGATVVVDGERIGVTPFTAPVSIITGKHKVQLLLTNYRTEEREVTVSRGQVTDVDVTLQDMATYNFTSKPQGSALYINGEYKGLTPYKTELATGTYDIKLEHAKYRSYHKKMQLRSSEPEVPLSLKRQLQGKYQMYIMPSFQVGNAMAFGATLGGYVYNANIEAFYQFGLSKTSMFWNSIADEPLRPVEESFSPSFLGGRVGYGFIIGTRLRITPQVGFGIAMIKGNEGTSCNASFASIGAKVDFAIVNHFGVSLTPEYDIAVSKSKTFKTIEPFASKTKGWASGFNCRIGLYVFF